MDKNDCPIPGCDRYSVNIVTHEIRNGKGKIMSPYLDSRGRLTVQLTCEKGKRTTMIVKDLVKKMGVSVGIEPSSASIEERVLLSFYNNISTETQGITLMSWAKIIERELPSVTRLEIGRILQKIIDCLRP